MRKPTRHLFDFNLHLLVLFLVSFSPLVLIFFSVPVKSSVITSGSEEKVIWYLPEVRGKENSE